MPLELEYEFYDFDKKKIINKLKNLGAKKKKGDFYF
jgi:hypothetical protein